ncbi:MAG TPA: ferritin-like domain-containing protein [Dehalococcoidia bacterium]|nr:ferritin-like domain-containing protein [Dehalococcoidia bacterium]
MATYRQDVIDRLKADGMDLSWLDAPSPKGARAEPGKKGLTLEAAAVDGYNEVPRTTDNLGSAIRGAAERPEVGPIMLRWGNKAVAWSESVELLYEEALQRQWSSARDIPWDQLTELPDDVELAMCQVATFFNQVEFIAGDQPGRWVQNLSPDHFEVGLFLSTQVMDEARHLDVFRKRALANGGKLMLGNEPASGALAQWDFSQMTAQLHVLGEGFVQTMFRMGEWYSFNEAEKKIYRLAAQDESRHVAFGVMHLKYLLETEPERREQIHSYFDMAETGLGAGNQAGVLTGSGPTAESLAVLLGAGAKNIDEGWRRLFAINKRQVQEYVHRLDVIGMSDRLDRMNPRLKAFIGVN